MTTSGLACQPHRGPRLALQWRQHFYDQLESQRQLPTWRGWVFGLCAVVLIGFSIPYLDFIIGGTRLSNSLFPATSIFLLFVGLLFVNGGAALLRQAIRLTRADLLLIFCMTLVVTAIPGCGFWAFWAPAVSAGVYYAKPENRWAELVLPYLPESWVPQGANGSFPIEWFYNGLSPEHAIPWSAWLLPYAVWSLAFLFMAGLCFALCGLLQRQWSDQERLAFPLAQIPEEMTSGSDAATPFIRDKRAWWGIGLAVVILAWNSLPSYYQWIPPIPLRQKLDIYLTEEPWNIFKPLFAHFYLSVIALTCLLSLEVGFSLWFYFVVYKLFTFISVKMGLGKDGGAFWNAEGSGSLFISQGTGALLALTLISLWMARSSLRRSLLQALKPDPVQSDGFSPRLLWNLLLLCFCGSVGWLCFFGISLGTATLAVVLLILILTGITRLTCEGGLFFVQNYNFPAKLTSLLVTPSAMGSEQFVRLSIWDRVMAADWFRVPLMPGIMHGIHIASRTGLDKRAALGGMAGAVLLALGLSYCAFLYTAYRSPLGARQMSIYFDSVPRADYGRMAETVRKLEHRSGSTAETTISDKAIDERDLGKAGWMGLGGGFLILSLALRKILMWFPHPIGYVMWMAPYPMYLLFFSIFTGWALKFAIVRYGGGKLFGNLKRFFIGMLVGEAVSIVFWKLIAVAANNPDTHSITPG